jgi:hypothetical protein
MCYSTDRACQMNESKSMKNSFLKLVPVLIIIAIATTVTTISCSKQLFIIVPDSKTTLFDQSIPLFNCTNCPGKYAGFCLENFPVHNEKLEWHPFSAERLKDTNTILLVHNTLKSVGYKNLLPEYLYAKKYAAFVDSLLFWESLDLDTSNYYFKFWQRRKVQQNNLVLATILKDIQGIYNYKTDKLSTFITDSSLYKGLELDIKMANTTYSDWNFSLDVFNYLIDNDQFTEAYTLLYKPHDLKEFGLNKMQLLQALPIDTIRSVSFNYNDSTTLLGHFDKKGNWQDSHIEWLDYTGP